jgi:predicted DNA-binding protein
MAETEIILTEHERNALQEISERTGKTESQLIRDAVDRFIALSKNEDRLILIRKARGIWKDRQDLSSLEDLRREWNRV